MMSENAIQKNRKLQSSLGDDLLLIDIKGYEAMSTPFSYRLKFISKKKGLKPEDYIGQSISFSLNFKKENTNQYHGTIAKFSAHAFMIEDYYIYDIELVPWFWLLKKRSNCQIFQNKSVKEILIKIFNDAGYQDYIFKLQGDLPVIPYCTQYCETDFHFVSRLLEYYGILYYFQHDDNKSSIVFANHNKGYMKSDENEIIHKDLGRNRPSIFEWKHGYAFQSGEWGCNSHNFLKSDNKLEASTSTSLPLKGVIPFKRYEEMGIYQDQKEGKSLTQYRMEADESLYSVVEASSNYSSFRVGETITLMKPDFPGESVLDYLMTTLEFHAIERSYLRTPLSKGEPLYHNRISCVPSNVVMRPKKTLQKPMFLGMHEAMITGDSSQPIYTNDMGCYKIQFYWDRKGKSDENSSCWVRAVHHWEGLLRVGQPVLISFIQGDIDRPIIMGPVHNDKISPLYSLPAQKTRSGIKRRWPKKEGQDDYKKYNELYFEDKPDNEELGLYAGKNMAVTVINDRVTSIQSNDTTTIKKKRMVTIEEENDQLDVNKGDLTITIKEGNYLLSVKKGNITIDAKSDVSIKAGGNLDLQAGKAIQIKAGSNLELEAGQGVTMKSGTNMDIKSGTSLTQQASASMKISANANCDIQGSMMSIKGSGMTKVSGGMIKLN